MALVKLKKNDFEIWGYVFFQNLLGNFQLFNLFYLILQESPRRRTGVRFRPRPAGPPHRDQRGRGRRERGKELFRGQNRAATDDEQVPRRNQVCCLLRSKISQRNFQNVCFFLCFFFRQEQEEKRRMEEERILRRQQFQQRAAVFQ